MILLITEYDNGDTPVVTQWNDVGVARKTADSFVGYPAGISRVTVWKPDPGTPGCFDLVYSVGRWEKGPVEQEARL